MGWDYNTYNQQPLWFVDLVKMKMEVDGEFREIELKKLNRKNGRR